MKKLILAMCTASLLFSCTDDDSLSTNSAPVADNNGIEVVDNSSLKFEIMAKQLYVASQRVL